MKELADKIMDEKMIDKIYVIHLNPSYDIEETYERLSNIGVPEGTPYEIVQAFNGHTNKLPEGYGLYSGWNLKSSGYKWWDRHILPGEAGCAVSHIQVWEQILKEGVENSLILEQDFISKRSLTYLNFDVIKPNYDIATLGRKALFFDNEEDVNDQWVKPLLYHNSHAHILSQSGIKKLLSTNIKSNLIPIDEFISACQTNHRREDIRKLFPPILNGFATKEDFIEQTSTKETSTTENNQNFNL